MKTVPITSYGVIAYRFREEPEFLTYQRRDTFGYMDFLKGRWKSENDLPRLFSTMSCDEQNRLLKYGFDELWNDLWVNHDSRSYNSNARSKEKYESIQHLIPTLVDGNPGIDGPPWGFPKGRKNSNEKPIECAKREFEEETNMRLGAITNINPLCEEYNGTDGKAYRSYYYITCEDIPIPDLIHTPQCMIRKYTASDEAWRIKWVTLDEAKSLLSRGRIELLEKVISKL